MNGCPIETFGHDDSSVLWIDKVIGAYEKGLPGKG